MKKREMVDTESWYRAYSLAGGIHTLEEFKRFSNILTGILKSEYGETVQGNPEIINFSHLISNRGAFTYWVDYAGSIKEARLYIKAMLEVMGKSEDISRH